MLNLACRLYGARDLRIEETNDPEPSQETAVVRVLRSGICKPDVSYFRDGAVGPIKLQMPFILGHEAAGVVEIAPLGSQLKVNQMVAMSPLQPCGTCRLCQAGLSRHCLNMRVNGTAHNMPHDDGFLRAKVSHPAHLCVPMANGVSAQAAAGVTPLAICLNAFARAPSVEGKRVLITGVAPFGAICLAIARLRGASEIIVASAFGYALKVAEKMGADRVINIMESDQGFSEYMTNKGEIDIVFECSTNAHALAHAIRVTRPQGTIIQVGVGTTMPVAMNLVVTKELQILGSYYFDSTFTEAVDMISTGRIDLSPMVTQVFTAEDAVKAFEYASDQDKSVKVQLNFAA